VEPDAKSTGRQVVTNCAALLVIGMLPLLVGLSGPLSCLTALLCGAGLLGYGIRFAFFPNAQSARQLLLASLLYLPVVLIAMAVDKVPM
jgi:protoheme IX farnesyltransferase